MAEYNTSEAGNAAVDAQSHGTVACTLVTTRPHLLPARGPDGLAEVDRKHSRDLFAAEVLWSANGDFFPHAISIGSLNFKDFKLYNRYMNKLAETKIIAVDNRAPAYRDLRPSLVKWHTAMFDKGKLRCKKEWSRLALNRARVDAWNKATPGEKERFRNEPFDIPVNEVAASQAFLLDCVRALLKLLEPDNAQAGPPTWPPTMATEEEVGFHVVLQCASTIPGAKHAQRLRRHELTTLSVSSTAIGFVAAILPYQMSGARVSPIQMFDMFRPTSAHNTTEPCTFDNKVPTKCLTCSGTHMPTTPQNPAHLTTKAFWSAHFHVLPPTPLRLCLPAGRSIPISVGAIRRALASQMPSEKGPPMLKAWL